MKESVACKDISELNIDNEILAKLRNNKINVLGQFINITKTDLRNMGFENTLVNMIEIQLQLLGAKLKGSL